MTEKRTTSSTGGQKGVKMARYDLIPALPLEALARHYGRGALKYDDDQWRQGYEFRKSYAALQRHAVDWLAGMTYDVCSNRPDECSHVTADGEPFEAPETDTCYNHTGSHHMAAVAWHAFCLLEFAETHPEHDDRYRPEPLFEVDGGWIEEWMTQSPEDFKIAESVVDAWAAKMADYDHAPDRSQGWVRELLTERQDEVDAGAARFIQEKYSRWEKAWGDEIGEEVGYDEGGLPVTPAANALNRSFNGEDIPTEDLRVR